jgi:CRP-like cAMP-binding protein
VLDGILARETLLSDQVSTELLGPGDPIRAQCGTDPAKLLRSEIRWTVVEPAQIAVLDAGFVSKAAAFPEIAEALTGRLFERTHRLAAIQALSQLTGVSRRILALFWHLAERWGKIGSDGVHLPLRLPHRFIANLIGARRPTVSTALHALIDEGAISACPTGGWVLHGEPFGAPTEETIRVVPLRKRRFHRAFDPAHRPGIAIVAAGSTSDGADAV